MRGSLRFRLHVATTSCRTDRARVAFRSGLYERYALNSPVLSSYRRLAGGCLGLRSFREPASAAVQLFGVPYAGGQSLAFRWLVEQLPATWGVWAIDPPGHGWANGPALESVEEMASLYLEQIPPAILEGGVLFGHSLGGCVVFEMAHRLIQRGRPLRAMVLAGTRPPHRRDEYESFLSMDDRQLLEALIAIGGVPPQWADEPEIFELFKDALRADFRAFESYEVTQPLDDRLPVLVVGGLNDAVCRPYHVYEWSQYCHNCRIEFVEGEHLFLQTHPQPLAQRMTDFVATLTRSNGDPE